MPGQETDPNRGTDDDRVAGVDRTAEWAAIKARYLRPKEQRPASAGNGLHHFALLCRDVEQTIRFFDGLLEFPLVELFENRDYPGSTHLFFDVGHGNYLAYFDFPGREMDAYAEVLGGLHHIAISVTEDRFHRLVGRLEEAGVPVDRGHERSAYFRGPDGERLELCAFPLDDMYGTVVR